MLKKNYLVRVVCAISCALWLVASAEDTLDYQRASWHPMHFQPQIQTASNEQCLSCHREVLDDKPLVRSPAGVEAKDALAWYQTLTTYEGEQETFHRRHLVAPMAQRLMNMKCNTCHQGHDPREQAIIPPDSEDTTHTLRKTVNPQTCVMCHGQFPYELMGLPSEWHASGEMFSNDCMLCHAAIRTARHQVNFLKADAIEEAGRENSDVCYGCHGGRSWYRIAFPYPRHPWPGMPDQTPEWAKQRPTESQTRFLAR